MSSKSRRRPNIPPRPQLISEQLRQQITAQTGDQPKILNRQQCMEFTALLAANLDKLLNTKTQLPWIQSSIDKRADGFTLNVQIIQPTNHTDAHVVDE